MKLLSKIRKFLSPKMLHFGVQKIENLKMPKNSIFEAKMGVLGLNMMSQVENGSFFWFFDKLSKKVKMTTK